MRTGSLNSKLAELAVETIAANGGAVDLASMEEFDSPSFDADDESEVGLPSGAQNFRERLEASDGFVIASPEYNGSMPGTLKNVIDWVSRRGPSPSTSATGCCCPPPHRWRVATAASGL